MSKKAILIVLDSVGIGALDDAAAYGDVGADTLGHIINTCHPHIPNLMEMGLGHIDDISFAPAACALVLVFRLLYEFISAKISRFRVDSTAADSFIAGLSVLLPALAASGYDPGRWMVSLASSAAAAVMTPAVNAGEVWWGVRARLCAAACMLTFVPPG